MSTEQTIEQWANANPTVLTTYTQRQTPPPHWTEPCEGWAWWGIQVSIEGRELTLQFPYGKGPAHRRWKNNKTVRHGLSPWGSNGHQPKPGKEIPFNVEGKTIAQAEFLKLWSEPIPPTREEILSCVADFLRDEQNYLTFEDYAEDFGLDTDSRRAYQGYRLTVDYARTARAVLPNDLAATLAATEPL